MTNTLPCDLSHQQKKRFKHDAASYLWAAPYLFKVCNDQLVRRCVPDWEQQAILAKCHESPYGGHFVGQKTACKVLQCGFYWPSLFKDAHSMVNECAQCQKSGGLTWRNEMPRHNILEVELFDVGGVDFMGLFPLSYGQKYILVAVDYISK